MSKEASYTPGPWEYVPSNKNHGPYVANGWGAGDICDCYVMSNPTSAAVCNGGTSKPIHMQHDEADANARLIAAAPEMFEALERILNHSLIRLTGDVEAMIIHALAKAKGE